MANKSYYELLKHPKWQAKRLEVLSEHGFLCRWCGSQEKTLHVHHTVYVKGRKPWEYSGKELVSLCVDCHERATEARADLNETLAHIDADGGFGWGLWRVSGYAKAMSAHWEMEIEPRASYFEIESGAEAMGVADYFGITAEQVIESADPKYSGGVIGLDAAALLAMDPRRKSEAVHG